MFEEDIEQQQLVVLSPLNNYHSQTKNIDFIWAEVEGADEYKVKIVTPNFGNPTKIVLDTVINTTNFTKIFKLVGDFQWSLQAQNHGYETNQIVVRTFHIDTLATIDSTLLNIDTIPPAIPKLVFPLNNDSVFDSIANFSWVSLGEEYDSIFIHFDSLGTNLFTKEKSTNLVFQLNEVDSISYYWKVKSYDLKGNGSEYSEVRKINFK